MEYKYKYLICEKCFATFVNYVNKMECPICKHINKKKKKLGNKNE